MKVFISWSGERSRRAAEGLATWLPKVDKRFKPWMSQQDIQAGDRWNEILERNLADADVGVVCLTPENVERPWLLFEAGALSNALGKTTRVIPYLLFDLTVNQLPQPFEQFHASRADFDGTFSLVRALRLKPWSDELLRKSFERQWPMLDTVLNSARKASGEPWRSRFELRFPSEYNDDLKRAKEVFLVGVSLEKTLTSYTDVLQGKCDLRVLISSPEKSVVEGAVTRKTEKPSLARAIRGKLSSIDTSMSVFRNIRKAIGKHTHSGRKPQCWACLKTTRYPLSYAAHVMDPRTSSGVIYLKVYPYRVQNAQKPWIVMRANRDRDYSWFLKELEALWVSGQKIDCSVRPKNRIKRTVSAD
jgi:hypothetical protein